MILYNVISDEEEQPMADSAFYFIFESNADAERARAKLRADGYSVIDDASDEWVIISIPNMPEDEYFAADPKMEKLAQSLGGVYDGAEREIVESPGIPP